MDYIWFSKFLTFIYINSTLKEHEPKLIKIKIFINMGLIFIIIYIVYDYYDVPMYYKRYINSNIIIFIKLLKCKE